MSLGVGHLSKVLRSVQLLPGDTGFLAKCRLAPKDPCRASNKSAEMSQLNAEVLAQTSWNLSVEGLGGCQGGGCSLTDPVLSGESPPASPSFGQAPASSSPTAPQPHWPPGCSVSHPGIWPLSLGCLEHSTQTLNGLAPSPHSRLRPHHTTQENGPI